MPFAFAVVLLVLCGLSFGQDAGVRTLADMEGKPEPWASKFNRWEIVDTQRDGMATKALKLTFDLSGEPGYDWVRVRFPEPFDTRPFKYLSFRIYSSGAKVRATVMLMRPLEGEAGGPNREQAASAGDFQIPLSFQGWKQLSIPLSAFGNLWEFADRAQWVNLSLHREELTGLSGELMLDDIRLTSAPEGEVVTEQNPYPPADIAIKEPAEFFNALNLDLPELAAVKAAVEAGDWNAAKAAWARHLETRITPRWLWSRKDKQKIMDLYKASGRDMSRSVPAADRVLAREFNFLGVPKKLEHAPEWLQGPLEWTHVLSRFGYWRDLGFAYWATGESKYAEDFVFLLEDWVAKNPVPRVTSNNRGTRGSVWRTLETGIRGDGWPDSMEMFMDAPEFDAEAKYVMCKSLVEQARYLHRYEVRFSAGNWQVVECTGLAAIGVMLPECKEAGDWRQRGWHYLVEHMQRDVYPDGAHSEVTPGYHGWVMEQFLRASRLAALNGYEVPGLTDRHEKMYEFLMYISKPDRRFPSLGDAGSGGSIQGNMAIGALLYNRPDMRYLGVKDPDPGWVWTLGADALDRYAKMEARPPAFTSSFLPNAKYYVMRTGWEAPDRYLLFDCAPWGGGHSHQDRLQVICYAGRDLLMDSGQYSYDQPLSGRYFRRSVAHNVILIDDGEQPDSNPEVLAWHTAPQFDFAAGSITGKGISHQRSVMFVKPGYWVVVDHVSGEGTHRLTRLFHFPRVGIQAADNIAQTQFPDGNNISVVGDPAAKLEMREGYLPGGAAKADPAPVAAFDVTCALPATFVTVLTPFANASELPKVEFLSGISDPIAHVRLTFGDGQVDEMAIAAAPTDLQVAGTGLKARALCVRRGPQFDGELQVTD